MSNQPFPSTGGSLELYLGVLKIVKNPGLIEQAVNQELKDNIISELERSLKW